MTATRPTTDEIFKFVLENGAELPDVKDIKCRVYGTGKDQVEEQSDDPCPHGKIIVNGRWGCLDCYKQIREKEVVWLNKLTDGERVARLKKLLEHNKRCWEKLGDWTPGGKRSTCCPRVTAEYFSFREEETRKHYDRWAEVRREMGYRGDWVKYVRFEPNFEKVNIGSHYHGGILCPQGRKINGTRLCKEHWQQNKKDISDLALERRGQRGKEFLRTGWLAEDMMGGFAANCPTDHPFVTFEELGIEFDHAFPPPESKFQPWEETGQEEATPKEKAPTRLIKGMMHLLSSK